MPIDKTVFLREMALLAELFNRPQLSEPLVARYYEHLSAHLTTSEFQDAAKAIFTGDQFWPTPARFLHAAKGDPAQLARQEWDRLLEDAAKGQLAPLSEAGKAALRALGGWSRVAYANEGALPSLRKAFLESYGDASATPDRQLLEATT